MEDGLGGPLLALRWHHPPFPFFLSLFLSFHLSCPVFHFPCWNRSGLLIFNVFDLYSFEGFDGKVAAVAEQVHQLPKMQPKVIEDVLDVKEGQPM